jgi:Uma2 family endonuclease
MAVPVKKRYTTEEFDRFVTLPENADKLFELIAGEGVEVSPSNPYSSHISGWVQTFINMYLLENPIGYTTGEQGGYIVSGDRYAPDVGYISKSRQPQLVLEGYNPNPPDLAVEVMSPSDSTRHISVKIANYLAVGTTVWVIYPKAREVEVYRPGQTVEILDIHGVLDGGEVLPGFTLPVKDIFPEEQE